MKGHNNSVLLSDAPVGLEGDLIWGDSDIGLDVTMISSTILESEDPLIFAVHGPWGSGKTSFLKMIAGELRKQETEKVYTSWYNASNYQTVGDASTTLTLRILKTLSEGDTQASAEQLYNSLLKPPKELESRVTGTYGFLEELAGKVAVLADLGVVIEDFLNGGMGAGKSKLVLMVDDLDRCSLEFIGDLIETTQRLNSVKNLFIILAVDRTRLQNALEERFKDVNIERGPRWAGEKYIQYAIELPPLDDEKTERFIHRLLSGESLEDYSFASDPVLKTMLDATDFFLAAIRDKMPRTIKACINLVRPALVKEMTSNPSLSKAEKRKIIKRNLIEYLFHNFYTNWLLKAETDAKSPEFKFLIKLEDLCQTYFSSKDISSDTKAVFAFSVQRHKAANLLEDRGLEVPEELARLLAFRPFFAYEERREEFVETGLTEKLMKIYYSSEEAEKKGDKSTCVSKAKDAYNLVSNNRSAVGNVAWLLGNLAINAEKFLAYDLAEALCRLAIGIDPTHVNNMLIFSSFILENRPNLYSEAMSLLQAVITKHPRHEKIGRAYSLLIRLKQKLGMSIDHELEQLTLIAKQTSSIDKQASTLKHMFFCGQEMKAIDLFLNVIAPKLIVAEELVNMQIRVAYHLTRQGEDKYDLIAMDFYRQILEAPDLTNPRTLSIVMYSYAHLLQKHGYDNEASRLFYKSYVQRPESNTIKRLYPKFLKKIGADELAKKVAAGEPLGIEQPVSVESSEDIPECFSTMNIPTLLQLQSEA